MLRFTVPFGAGALFFHQLADIPHAAWLLLLLPLAALCAMRCPRGGGAALLAGFAWSHLFALLTIPPSLPLDGDRVAAVADGRIVSLVERRGRVSRFVFEASRLAGEGREYTGQWRLRLGWYDAPSLAPGQSWRFPVRLRAATGYASPGAWDFEGWLYWQGIRHSGYVNARDGAELLSAVGCCRIARWRDALSSRIAGAGLSDFASGVIRAITVGDRGGLDSRARALFRDTGTSHLMAISGLHVSLVAGLAGLLTGLAWRSSPRLCRRLPAPLPAAAAGWLAALVYAVLAGLGLPTQRALIMLGVVVAAMTSRRQARLGHSLAVAALLVLLWHPPSVIAAGFWLSFLAVAVIAAMLGLADGRPRWQRVGLLHLALGLGLLPALVLFGLPGAAVGPLANLLLIPLFSVLIVPGSLLGLAVGTVAPAAGAVLLRAVGWVLEHSARLLEYLAALPAPDLAAQAMRWPLWVALTLGLAMLFAPRGWPLRAVVLPLLALPWLPREPRLGEGSFELHLLDVGQGLSCVVETRDHVLVYDTGPAYPSGFSTATAVLAPFLRTRGIDRVDHLVLSHADIDHAGDAAGLAAVLPVDRVSSGEPAELALAAGRCVAGEGWEWNGVRFRFLHPPAASPVAGNDASCVLHISNDAGRVLLTGDIELRAEAALADRYRHHLESTLVVAPHHGSATSSSPALIDATRPDWVWISAGRANRYGFPDPEVIARWVAAGARPLSTADSGTVSLRFDPGVAAPDPLRHREHARRFWHQHPG